MRWEVRMMALRFRQAASVRMLRLARSCHIVAVSLHYTGSIHDHAKRGVYVGYKRHELEDNASSLPELVDVPRVMRTVNIGDARTRSFCLARDGFQLIRRRSAVHDFVDTREVLLQYVPEMRSVAADAVGVCGSRVIVWDLCLRDSDLNDELQQASDDEDAGARAALDQLAPVPLVHVDFHGPRDVYRRLRQRCDTSTDTLSSCMAADFGELTRADVHRHVHAGARVVSLNVWRSTDRMQPIRRDPLAICHPKSVPESERLPFAIMCPDVTLVEAHVAAANARAHDWWHFPAMTADECLIFVSGDTHAKWPAVPHTSFAHPATQPDDPPRKSIEARVFVLFEREE